jgi:ribosome-associated protein
MTAIQLRFNIIECATLPHDVQQRLIHFGGSRVNSDYQLVITAKRHRSQERNKREALERLCELVRKAAERRVPRLKRRRSHAENQSRLEEKRRRSETKSRRQRVSLPND